MPKAVGLVLIFLLSLIPSIGFIPQATALEDQSEIQTIPENSWTEMAPLLTPRSGLGVVSVDGRIFAVGGRSYTRSGDTVGTNEVYDPNSNNWTTKAPMPTARANFGIVAYDGKIYCFGGETDNITTPNHIYGVDLAINEVYDPTTDTWATRASMPTARSFVEVNEVNGKIYVMGGEPDQALNYAYDPISDNWTVKNPVPNIGDGYNRAEISAASATFNGKIYWIGIVGFYDYLPGMLILNQVYDPVTDSWSQRSSPPRQLPGPLPETAAVTTGTWAPERIYIFGPNKTRYVYDPSIDKWTFAKYMPQTVTDFGVAVLDDKIYLIGGAYFYTAADLNQQYTPFGYGTTPPIVSSVFAQNSTFTVKDSLVFTVNKAVEFMNYSLDGQNNATFGGILSLAEVSAGSHSIVVFASDMFGNVGTSEIVYFTVKESEMQSSSLIAIGIIVGVAFVMAILVFLLKRKQSENDHKI